MAEYEYHELAREVPAMPSAELRELAKDIKANGLQVPIVLYEGKILDGRHRYHACVTEGIEPVFVDFEGDDPFDFVLSMNLHRRHLSAAQLKRLAQTTIKRSPARSDNSIAQELGLDHKTVAVAREELEAETEAVGDPDGQGPLFEARSNEPAARVEKSGRKARGRKPQTRAQKAAAKEKALAKSKPMGNTRDEWVNMVAERIAADPVRALADMVQMMIGYDSLLQRKISKAKREEAVKKIASTLDVKI